MCAEPEPRMKPLTHNMHVPKELCEAAMRLFADSILAYHGRSKRRGDLRYYPPVILTFWSGFETFVRYSSEILVLTVPSVPPHVEAFLHDEVLHVAKDGAVQRRRQVHPVLDRYVALLRYGFGYTVDRGATYWQRLDAAKKLRDYYTHLDVTDPRAVSSDDVLDFMESVLLGIIIPSAQLKRTQMIGVYYLYWIWSYLRQHADLFVERSFFHDWKFPETDKVAFYCPFDGVDRQRFRSLDGLQFD